MTAFGFPASTETGHLLPAVWDDLLRKVLGLGPETRSPDQIKADRQAFLVETEMIVEKVKADHAAVVAAAPDLLRPILELHAPTADRYPRCDGCDMSGWEAEAPEFPCRTYELASGVKA
jgi:hypothetical protein